MGQTHWFTTARTLHSLARTLSRAHTRYPPGLRVLLVGDGNLSFGAALARRRGGGSGLTVTSYEEREELLAKYKETEGIVAELTTSGAIVCHGVDATRLPESLWAAGTSKELRFDRIVFQFPLVPLPASEEEFRRRPDPIVSNRLLIRR